VYFTLQWLFGRLHHQWRNQGVARGSLGHPILKKKKQILYPGIWQIVNDTLINPFFLSSILNFVSFANFSHSCSLHIVKLGNKMGHEFLADNMSVIIEREISACLSSESIIDDFKPPRKRKVSL
jgi:hypothetical protein